MTLKAARNHSQENIEDKASEANVGEAQNLSKPAPLASIRRRVHHDTLTANGLSPSDISHLQRTVGNKVVSQLLPPLQRVSSSISSTASPHILQRIVLNTENTAKTGEKNNADFTERPNEPHREKALTKTIFGGKEVSQTRHHIIPWNTLSAFIRKAYDRRHMFAVTDVLTPAANTMMANSPRTRKTSSGKVEKVAPDEEGGTRTQGSSTLENLTTEIGKDRDTAEKNTEHVDALTTAYCWMPGNLFLGPLNTLRLDDPDEGFEEGAADQVGSKFDQFKETYDNIKKYLVDPKALLARDIRDFLQEVAGQTAPYDFKESSWVRVEDNILGRFYLKNNAELPAVKSFLSPKVKPVQPKASKPKKQLTAEQLLEIERRKEKARMEREKNKQEENDE